MAPRSFLFASDEEMAKRDDDHRPGQRKPWLARGKSTVLDRLIRNRILGVIGACLLLYLFFYNMPTNLGEANKRIRPQHRQQRAQNRVGKHPASTDDTLPDPHAPPPYQEKTHGPAVQTYEGPIKFYQLATSLHGISKTMGHRNVNHNVLFAASDLKSAAAIIPLACEMSRWKRNYVHVTVMGRAELPLEDIKEINGAQKEVCDVYWHDARPDYATYSSDKRMEGSIAGALSHIHSFMHPQAIITADSAHEDNFFTRGIRSKAKELDLTLISLPQENTPSLSWLARLESGALNKWHTATIDMIVQAPPTSAGSLIRLLKSLEAADYAGFLPPRLTIELPHKIDEPTHNFLKSFEWPPQRYLSHFGHGQNNQLILRRRIDEKKIQTDEASMRFIESFYPSNPEGSHVLVLSPQAELSPVFFHYLKYHILEYRYSSNSLRDSNKIIGVSLESPSMYLNGTSNFTPPVSSAVDSTKANAANDGTRMDYFLWQAPNSNAALYFSDDWMEIHSFLTKRQSATEHPATKSHHQNRKKYISEKNPAWTEYFLDLMKVRGYYLLYPELFSAQKSTTARPTESLVIVHNELYQPPEEFTHHEDSSTTDDGSEQVPSDVTVLTADSTYLYSHHPPKSQPNVLNVERPLLQSLTSLLSPPPSVVKGSDKVASVPDSPPSPALPALSSIPLLDYRGEQVDQRVLERDANKAATDYRSTAGGCPEDLASLKEKPIHGSAEDLFCLYDVEEHPAPKAVTEGSPPITQDNAQHTESEDDAESASVPSADTSKPAGSMTGDGDSSSEGSDDQEHPPPDPSKPTKKKSAAEIMAESYAHARQRIEQLNALDKETAGVVADSPANVPEKMAEFAEDMASVYKDRAGPAQFPKPAGGEPRMARKPPKRGTSDYDEAPPAEDWKHIKKGPSGAKDLEIAFGYDGDTFEEKHRDITTPTNKNGHNTQGRNDAKYNDRPREWDPDREREVVYAKEKPFKSSDADGNPPKWEEKTRGNPAHDEGEGQAGTSGSERHPPLPKPQADDEEDERVVASRMRGKAAKTSDGDESSQDTEKKVKREMKDQGKGARRLPPTIRKKGRDRVAGRV